MKFEEAVKLLKEGKKVRRRKWTQGDGIIVSSLGYLSWSKKEIHPNLSFESYVADDWEEFKEEDDWDFISTFTNLSEVPIGSVSNQIKKLKAKILEDIDKIDHLIVDDDTPQSIMCIFTEKIKEIILKRFGF